MLFNSYPFIFVYLPITVMVYFALTRQRWLLAAKCWLAFASIFFYGWWDYRYIPLIVASIGFNYSIGRILGARAASSEGPRIQGRKRKWVLIAGISANLLLLGYYKYANFFLENVSAATGRPMPMLHLVLPLGISFFTFTQIAYLVDVYKEKAREANVVQYTLFVTFFPHLIAGPILHHSEMMPQFDRLRSKLWDWRNAAAGLYLFTLGLIKKVVIADTLAPYANDGFAHARLFLESWVASLSYTLQLYFDFSGYTDMAIGLALLFNIRLPQNFNSPYKARNIQDFWRRWHMTLSRFLRDYIYIPLGGNRKGESRMLVNLMITFLLGGLWHGAGWTFLMWGFLHGAGQIIHRLWSRFGVVMPRWLAWLITFQFINLTWVFFRADSWNEAFRIIRGMTGVAGLSISGLEAIGPAMIWIALLLPVVLFMRNTKEREQTMQPNWRTAAAIGCLFVFSLMYFNKISTFLYFNF
ncbi:membrane bound O-acyl transferase MBOAT family protein [Paenibacillus curdlanolyticus YK9]|uniref:Membrane bound O-acyl transferase MBOAT family protein n=1 Tax=Paenibacillus curdlanolyticus YK9 TaxID=717606 RepID=E0I2Z2_9BACL|nr:MBOAT family protein [Paenibacillus curdlanolyticus]EFM12656.1 membrane bound O-acyl transferase MBOAT family protein [Paenibacillus curdlanolyticus YK9]